MAQLSTELINEIRNNIDIVSIISNYVVLTKKGKNYFGVCPFHDDHSPSMSVSSDKQIYKCFSCGASGNVFNFVSDFEHISFYESVLLLANKLGYNIEKGIKKEKKINKDLEIYQLAEKFYQNNLFTSMGKNAISYLEERKIDKDTIKKFGIGLALNKNILTELLISKNYSLDSLINLGLTTENSSDFFQNRIIFPIWNLNGETVAFSGRIYNTKDSSKYVNTKETSIFKKGQILYNYHNVKEVLKKNREVIIMEGFLDVIRASSIGINNCVASLGTSVTKEQVSLLKKMTDNVLICFDGDEAGRNATLALAKMLEEADVNVKVVILEDNLDPDEYILRHGKDRFLKKIEKPLSLIEFKMRFLKENKNLEDIEQLSNYINTSLLELAKEKDEIIVELTLKKMQKEFNISYDNLFDKLKKLKENQSLKVANNEVVSKKEEILDKYIIAQKKLLFYMIKSEKVLNMVKNKVLFFPNDEYRHLANELIYYFDLYGIIKEADFISYVSLDEELKNTFLEIIDISYDNDYKEEEIEDYINVLNGYNKKMKVEKLEKKLNEEEDPLKQAEILKDIMYIRGEFDDRRN